ncbi:MAG: DNA gyrase inhibitor YacG [Methylorubrum populi]
MKADPAKTSAPPCPICGKPAQPETKPFCSARCADIDLGRWLGERYVIPGPEEGELPRPEHIDDVDRSH